MISKRYTPFRFHVGAVIADNISNDSMGVAQISPRTSTSKQAATTAEAMRIAIGNVRFWALDAHVHSAAAATKQATIAG